MTPARHAVNRRPLDAVVLGAYPPDIQLQENAMADKKTEKSTPVIDKRLVDRMVAKGVVTYAEFEKQLQALPDAADKAENIAPLVFGNDQ
jgi:hypothetical protein